MARYNGLSRLALTVWGDWTSMMSAREYRDVLLDQGPLDEDGAEYKSYEIPCENLAAIVAAYQVFKPLARTIGVSFEVQSGEFRCRFDSDCGYGSKTPSYWATIDDQRRQSLLEHLDAAMLLARELEMKVKG